MKNNEQDIMMFFLGLLTHWHKKVFSGQRLHPHHTNPAINAGGRGLCE
ncbi:hypothetical protein [Edwardsiella tarda]